jgi:hypothetical protein
MSLAGVARGCGPYRQSLRKTQEASNPPIGTQLKSIESSPTMTFHRDPGCHPTIAPIAAMMLAIIWNGKRRSSHKPSTKKLTAESNANNPAAKVNQPDVD